MHEPDTRIKEEEKGKVSDFMRIIFFSLLFLSIENSFELLKRHIKKEHFSSFNDSLADIVSDRHSYAFLVEKIS
jgi:hypothetical protein